MEAEKVDNSHKVHEEEDDNCSEFSVISIYDDQDVEDMDSVHGGSVANENGDETLRVAYKDPSVHESEFADNMSSISHNVSLSNGSKSEMVVSGEMQTSSASWNPMAVSGYVPAISVAEMVEKVLKEYKQNHELLASINSSIMDLKSSGNRSPVEEIPNNANASEIEKLKSELTERTKRCRELEQEKINNERQFKLAAKDAENYILRLESQLSDQCQMSKALREELDEQNDNLRAARFELDTQKAIVVALQQQNYQSSEQMKRVCEGYEDQMKLLEQTFTSYHERGEKANASNQTNEQSSSILAVSHSNSANFGGQSFTCSICHCDCPSLAYFNYHIQTHANGFPCALCNAKFESDDLLKKHVQEVHLDNDSVPLEEDLISFADTNRSITPLSVMSASFILDSAASTQSISEAEEAVSTGFITPTEEQEVKNEQKKFKLKSPKRNVSQFRQDNLNRKITSNTKFIFVTVCTPFHREAL